MSTEERKFSVDGHVYRYGLVNGTRCWYTGYSCKVAVDDETERLLAALSTAEREREDAERYRALRADVEEFGYIDESWGTPEAFEHYADEIRARRARVPSGGEEGR